MRILWVTNLPVGEAPRLYGWERSVFGGWLEGLFDHMAERADLALSVAFPVAGKLPECDAVGQRATYYPFPGAVLGAAVDEKTAHRLRVILAAARPDLVHIFGTEMPHTVAFLRLCRDLEIPVVLQLQGIMGSISRHYFGWLSHELRRLHSVGDVLRLRSPARQQKAFQRASLDEAISLQLARHVIGRTMYDRAWSEQANPQVHYHSCEEILREPFYKSPRWAPRNCERHTILVSQASYPYKGVHVVIEALALIKERFPEVRLRIAGPHPFGGHGAIGWLRRSTYGRYLRGLARDLGVVDRIELLGPLDAMSMREAYLRSHVFVSSSSIENSSNSMAEATILGLPVVASFVGGAVDAVDHGKTGFLYQGDAPHMLAHHLNEIFSDDVLARTIGERASLAARLRHSPSAITHTTLRIYRKALSGAATQMASDTDVHRNAEGPA